MTAVLQQTTYEGLAALSLTTPQAALCILPSLGGKVVSLRLRPSDREFLWRHPDRLLRPVAYATAFDQADLGGWDECFPSIAAALCPQPPWQDIPVPDHGELWTLPWDWEFADDVLSMWTHSPRFGYRFERTFRPSATDGASGGIVITYAVHNPTAFDLPAIWSMHPFLAVSPSSRVLLPPDVRMRIEISTGQRLGPFLSEIPWPRAHDRQANRTVDLSVMGPPQPATEKLYTTPLTEGWAALYHPDDEHFIAFTFNPADVPFMGVCHIRGGWPATGAPAYTVLLEPCTGWPDRLDLAAAHGAAMLIPPGTTRTWQVTLHIGRTPAALAACLGRPAEGLLSQPP